MVSVLVSNATCSPGTAASLCFVLPQQGSTSFLKGFGEPAVLRGIPRELEMLPESSSAQGCQPWPHTSDLLSTSDAHSRSWQAPWHCKHPGTAMVSITCTGGDWGLVGTDEGQRTLLVSWFFSCGRCWQSLGVQGGCDAAWSSLAAFHHLWSTRQNIS